MLVTNLRFFFLGPQEQQAYFCIEGAGAYLLLAVSFCF